MSVDVATPAPGHTAVGPVPRWYLALAPDIALFALCAYLVSVQLFVPPFIGMADNGDFPKVLGPLALSPAYDVHHKAYVVPVFRKSPTYRWKSPLFSSEIYFGRLAVGISRLFGNRDHFDIRYIGAVHAAFFLAAFLGLFAGLRRRSWMFRLPSLVFVAWVFCDAAYVAYYNSFYSDAAAIVSLFVSLALALLIAADGRPRWLPLLGFAAGSVLFITSKGQHGVLGFLPAGFLVWISWDWCPALRRFAIGLAAILLLVTITETTWLTPRWYRGIAAYNIVFYEIPRISPDATKDLQWLGVPPEDYRYLGSWAAMDQTRTLEWFADFSNRVSTSRLLRFYLEHPQRPSAMIKDAFAHATKVRAGIGNFCPNDGFPPYALTHRFASWSGLRAKIFQTWPLHIVLWYLFVFSAAVCTALRARSSLTRRAAVICGAVLFMGVAEFFISSLGDVVETDRHLFLFHTMTDISVCFAVAAILNFANARFRARRVPAQPTRAQGQV